MNLAFTVIPKTPPVTFLSACLDPTIKCRSSTLNFSMKAHEKGDNYVDFYPEADKLYLVTTGDGIRSTTGVRNEWGIYK